MAVLQDQMEPTEAHLLVGRLVKALYASYPKVTYEAWRECERLLPHVLAVAAILPEQSDDQEMAQVLTKAAGYLRERAMDSLLAALRQVGSGAVEQLVKLRPKFQLPGGVSVELGAG